MINFLLCILCNSGIFLTFRLFKSKGINTPMAITINYLVAACFGWLQAGGFEAMQESTSKPWFITTAIMGTGFLFLFNLMAKCTREFGVSIATMSTKLSMVIPISVFLIIHPEDQITLAKAIAISLAFLTIILSSNNSKEERKSRLDLLMPMIIFLGSGLDNSSVIPSLNVSVIILSTITALLLFKEKPSTKTWIGLALGCISISLFLLF